MTTKKSGPDGTMRDIGLITLSTDTWVHSNGSWALEAYRHESGGLCNQRTNGDPQGPSELTWDCAVRALAELGFPIAGPAHVYAESAAAVHFGALRFVDGRCSLYPQKRTSAAVTGRVNRPQFEPDSVTARFGAYFTSHERGVLARSDRPETMPRAILELERLEQAACDETARHGASRDDVGRLREHFRKRAVEKYQDVLIPVDEIAQTSDVSPSD